jgi:hypothetical protein
MMDQDRLYFPCEIAEVIGLSLREIAYMKAKGCPFYGRKTTVRWVRDFIARQAGAPMPQPPEHPQNSAVNRSGGRDEWSGLSTASLATR